MMKANVKRLEGLVSEVRCLPPRPLRHLHRHRHRHLHRHLHRLIHRHLHRLIHHFTGGAEAGGAAGDHRQCREGAAGELAPATISGLECGHGHEPRRQHHHVDIIRRALRVDAKDLKI